MAFPLKGEGAGGATSAWWGMLPALEGPSSEATVSAEAVSTEAWGGQRAACGLGTYPQVKGERKGQTETERGRGSLLELTNAEP